VDRNLAHSEVAIHDLPNAEAALFLASDRAGWLSGITVDVAGGSVLA
jgi:hypothetical protein